MKIRLISITKPVLEEIKGFTPEEVIVYCARISNPENQLNVETAPKLLKYLIAHQHWSPMQLVDFTVEITTSRAIAAQILRHKSADFQEYSQRYSEAVAAELIELRLQGKTNRQVGDTPLKDAEMEVWINEHLEQSQDLYKSLIAYGVAKECARMVLPLATQTTLLMKNNVRNWIHYLNLRTKPDTQKEHREIAEAIKTQIFITNFPNIAEALEWI